MNRYSAPVAALALFSALTLAGCSAPTTEPPTSSDTEVDLEVEAPDEAESAGESFVDGVLTTEEVKIEITDSRVIQVGEPGNEFGDVPVLALYYDTTNLGTSDRDITPSEFIFLFEAFQDNDPDRENTLEVGLLPDDAFLETQLENIKPDGTLSNAIAYELDDLTTPVDLVAGVFGEEIGRMTFNLN